MQQARIPLRCEITGRATQRFSEPMKSANVCEQPPTQTVMSFDSQRKTYPVCSQGAVCSS